MEYLCYVIGFCSLVRILTKKTQNQSCVVDVSKMHDTQNAFPKFLHISWFLKTDPNEAAKLVTPGGGGVWSSWPW